jgi:hypothetical protein
MDMTQIAILLLTIAGACLGWFAREIYQATQTLRKDISSLEVQIARDYVRYDRMQDAIQPILDAIADLHKVLERKVDK